MLLLFTAIWKKKYFSHFQWVHQSITNITEDSTNEKALYVTHEDICESFEGNTLLAIQAPNGTQLEVPIPEQSGLKKKYQIHLKSTDGQIYVLLGKNILKIVRAHIYISRKIRLYVVDLEGKFQTNLLARLINFLIWKYRSTIFCRICQIHYFSKELTYLNCDFCIKLQFKCVNSLEYVSATVYSKQ